MGTRRRRVSVIYFISKLVKWDDLRMQIISDPTQDQIKKAAQALKDGHLVAFPTETVYGLGADAINENAVSRVYSVKARPTDHPLIVHISSINQLDKWAIDIPGYAKKLAEEFWPGPMTLILKRSKSAGNFITGEQNSIAVRVPAHSIALSLLSEFEKLGGLGVVAPSANRFGSVSPTTGSDVEQELGNKLGNSDILLNAGNCLIGIESTIVNCVSSRPVILRPGAVTIEQINEILRLKISINRQSKNIKTSGMHSFHYSPIAKVVSNRNPVPGEGFLAMNNVVTPDGVIRLGAPNSVTEFARILYASFRLADKKNLKTIVVQYPLGPGLSIAIEDRIRRASGN